MNIQNYKLKTSLVTIPLAPIFANSVSLGIKDYLEPYLNTFIPSLNGTLINFHAKRILSSIVKNDSPFILVTVEFDMIVFEAKRIVAGIINFVGTEHIGVLIDGMVNATCTGKGEMGERVRVQVKSITEKDGIISIIGTLM